MKLDNFLNKTQAIAAEAGTTARGNTAPIAMLKSDEIKEICEKYNLSRGQVYNIRSIFSSMCTMSE
jgi:hypothetical protein